MEKSKPRSETAEINGVIGDTSLVLHSETNLSTLPPELQEALSHYETIEKVGVVPTWKPENPGDFIIGRVTDHKQAGKFDGSVMTLETAKGFFSVWLNADLELKIGTSQNGSIIGRSFVIQYEGWLKKAENPKLLNDMRLYKVIEVIGPKQ